MTTAATRPLPRPTDVSRPHWDGARRGELLVQRCTGCGRPVFLPALACPYCAAGTLEWSRSSGLGVVHTFTVVWRPASPAFEAPYVVAVVELDEGWHMLTNVVDCEPGEVWIGQPVEVAFRPVSDEITLPVFRPRPRSGATTNESERA
ncbi:MAG TPA: Zn-ribbon domain-containing OB-fold protein [Acidimicrobiia bacterium]|jgi:hypothetical protein|nr:Zn-ribbon domain-containing OB-fold protein [Acidimicrobiia bacterium]